MTAPQLRSRATVWISGRVVVGSGELQLKDGALIWESSGILSVGRIGTIVLPISSLERVDHWRGWFAHGLRVRHDGVFYTFRLSEGPFLFNSKRVTEQWLSAIEELRTTPGPLN